MKTQFEGWHHYPNAGEIDKRIQFLEHNHRHIFKIEAKMSVTHSDRELEFFLVFWKLNDYLKTFHGDGFSCETMANKIIDEHLIPNYGDDRSYTVVVSEDGENDGIVEYIPD